MHEGCWEWTHAWTAPKTDGASLLVGVALPERLLLCASDLSTRWQRNGHAMVTTGPFQRRTMRRLAKGEPVNIPAPGCGFCAATQLNAETTAGLLMKCCCNSNST